VGTTVAPAVPVVGTTINSTFDALQPLGQHSPEEDVRCPEPTEDVENANPGNAGYYLSFRLSVTHYCTSDVPVRISNFYIHSTWLGTGSQTTGCSGSGSCTAVRNWSSKVLPCESSGTAAIPFSYDYSDPTGSYHIDTEVDAAWHFECPK